MATFASIGACSMAALGTFFRLSMALRVRVICAKIIIILIIIIIIIVLIIIIC